MISFPSDMILFRKPCDSLLMKRRSLGDRFRNMAEQRGDGECWRWLGYISPDGRGYISVKGRPAPAARVAFYLEQGHWPRLACHTCDNPGCVNPAHIWDGSHADNARDAVSKGRHYYAARTHCKRGHEFSPENTRNHGTRRICRACDTIRAGEARAKAAAHRLDSEAGVAIGPGEQTTLTSKVVKLRAA